jgi:uncharacterized damage-inducible protein DinB
MGEATDLLLEIQRHSAWANRQILAAAERMPVEQLRTPIGEGGYGDLLETLLHMYDAQMTWLERATTGTNGPVLGIAEVSSIAALRGLWDELDVHMEVYINGLSDAMLREVVSYRSYYGSEGRYSHRDMFLHQAFHAHQHRGEVALVLSQLGYSPGEIDVIDYLVSERDGE